MGRAKKRINPKVVNHVNRNFIVLFIKAVIKAVHKISPPWEPPKKGRKGHDPQAVAVGCILKVGLNLSYDGIEAYIKDSKTLQHYYQKEGLIGHSVIERGMKRLSIKYIRKVMNRVTRFLHRKGMNIAVDGTGFRTRNSSIWYDIRIRRRNKRKECIKLHISVDVDTGVIHWFTITSWNRHDSKEFEDLLKHLPDLGNVFGDKAFSSRKNCQLVASKKGIPYLCFKDNATSKAKGNQAWIVSFRAYTRNKEKWLKIYHLRSLVESVFSAIKKRWGSFLRSKKRWMQKKELSLKVFAYNVKQVLLVHYAKKWKVPLWVSTE